MSPQERAKARALADAGVHDLKHLAKLAGLSHATVWRYWNQPPRRKDIAVMAALAKVLEIDVYDLADLLAGGSASIGYSAHTVDEQYERSRELARESANERNRALVGAVA